MNDGLGRPKRFFGLLRFAVTVVAGIAIGFVLARSYAQDRPDSAATSPLPVTQVADTLARQSDPLYDSRRTAITNAAEVVGPSVVTVTVTQVRIIRAGPALPFNDPFFEDFFRHYYPRREYAQRAHSMGSGFIVSHDGFILTNEHVVRGAAEIKVTLTDGREYPADLIGSDATYDLAVLKVEADDLPVAPLGSSHDLLVGEWVVAIGNPFGFLLENTEPTVTAGVISATHRDIRQSETDAGVYKEMIQTDAAINPGNSGGPLVNVLGDVIGINTFIFSKTGGSVGIGFAIPIDTAKRAMEELKKYGQVRKVWVGIRVQEITAPLAQYLDLADRKGVIVSYVEPESPASRAGIERGDVVRHVNGAEVQGIEEARRALFGAQVGDELTLSIIRNGSTREISFTLVEAASGTGGAR
ncbi:MAG: S1C family serine protease [bacterium]